jgi:hypothetical protein
MIAWWEGDALAPASSETHAVVVVGITVCAATPRSLKRWLVLDALDRLATQGTHHAQGHASVQLDETMEVTENDGGWQIHQVHGILSKEAMQLNIFGNQHPNTLTKNCMETIRG